jgi:hypothetical protein
LVKAGVHPGVPAYSVRHALITFLLSLGFSEVEVNAFTGHSNNYHTALNHYFHLDGNWAGNRIVEEALRAVPEKAERLIEVDNGVQRREEGEELDSAAEAGAAAASREELRHFIWTGSQLSGTRGEEEVRRRGMVDGKETRQESGEDGARKGARMGDGRGREGRQGPGPPADGRKEEGDPAKIGMGKPAAPSDYG